MSRMSAIVELATEVGGGAAAGFLDTKFQDKKIAGQGLGTVLAVAGIAAGISGIGGRLSKHALRIGAGAAAFEAGKLVQNKTLGVSGVRGVRGFAGVGRVGALPAQQQPLTAWELDRMFAGVHSRRAA